ncbi:MAG: histidine triad nucleotide-binding protein [Clostridiales bacterium]|nr:histidine triad nucleotide-binding protein [Clostridiales bacterium]
MDNCLFCKIIKGNIPSQKVYEDEHCYAVRDISPQSPAHVLILPKQHVSGLNSLDSLSDQELAACLRAAQIIAGEEGIADSGYRLVSNCGSDACQSVSHLHFHLMGGRKLSERMG